VTHSIRGARLLVVITDGEASLSNGRTLVPRNEGGGMKTLSELTEREILALAISSEWQSLDDGEVMSAIGTKRTISRDTVTSAPDP
jgi:hypothetical protein